MLKHYQFIAINHDLAIDELGKRGLQNPYTIEEADQILVGGFADDLKTDDLVHSTLHAVEKAEVDWEAQWQEHAPGFTDGQIELKLHNATVKLKAGPGFGDLSHPTTQLMIEMMQKQDLGASVLDLGCGSGILGCVAVKLNVKALYMVDIDPKALDHARENIELNGSFENVVFSTAMDRWPIDTILMNMIWQDQMAIFEAYPHLRDFKGRWIVSGILEKQKDDYLNWLGFDGVQLLEKDGWLGMIH